MNKAKSKIFIKQKVGGPIFSLLLYEEVWCKTAKACTNSDVEIVWKLLVGQQNPAKSASI